jgi:LytS/YehU family sensor histidine kinase
MVLLLHLIEKKINIVNYIFLILSILGVLTILEGYSDFLFNKLKNPFWDNLTVKLSMEYFDLTFLVNAFFLLLSFGYGFTLQWYKNEVLKRKLIQDNIQTELALLKAQINPHFLFNTLNNIFGLARKSNNQLVATSITKLADMMRYITYEIEEGKVNLGKEIKYLDNYIELQKLRFSKDDNISIEFRIQGPSENIYIEPMLFLPIVENAFKHGISLRSKSEIFLNFNIDSNQIVFDAKNTIAPSRETHLTSGVGLENLRKRLNLLYPGRHQLLINKNESYYFSNLTIKYNE